MAKRSIKQSPRWLRNWTNRGLALGSRVVLLASGDAVRGVVTDIRIVPHLKRFVIHADDGRTVYASESEVAFEADETRAPLGPSVHADD